MERCVRKQIIEFILLWKDLRLHYKIFPEEKVFTLYV